MRWAALALLAMATATNQVHDWSPEQEHTFHYSTSILSGIPDIGHQYAGLKLTAVVRAQKFPDQTIRIQFTDSKFKSYNNEFAETDRAPWSPPSHEDEEEVPGNIKTFLELPFKVITGEGLVEKIQCEDSEPEYITNIKKAAVTGLAALSKTNLPKSPDQFWSSFKAMETSIVGECETYYTIAKMPEEDAKDFEDKEGLPQRELCKGKDYYEVIKNKDLKICRERPIYLHLYGTSSVSDGSLGSSAPFTEESSLTRTVLCGSPDSYVLRKATNQHKYLISPTGKFENGEKMAVTSTQVTSFRSIETKQVDIQDVKSPKPRGSLMFEFPTQGSLKTAIFPRSSPGEESDDWYDAQVPQPDLHSAPASFFPSAKTAEENFEQLVRTFLQIVETSSQSPESSYSAQDVAGNSVVFTEILSRLSYQEIVTLWTRIDQRLHRDAYVRENAYSAFLDLVSISGTNPSTKYIIDVVWLSRIHLGQLKLKGEAGAWIMANTLRSIKTPTEELLKELTKFLKDSTPDGDYKLASAVAFGLTNLIHRACVHETSSVYDFPVKTYGRFCDEKSLVITRELIPFLAEKLSTAGDMYTQITYINALGNLGHDAASFHLMKAIEGRPSLDPHPRSVAVFQLIKSAKANPGLYRPVLVALIENLAEDEEVRMAAITVLPYTRPSSSDFNKLAISTWWEPSAQVAHYITSTLKTLSEAPAHSQLFTEVSRHAQEAVQLAKPTSAGIQTSHNVMVVQFLESLQAAVTLDLRYITSRNSPFPRSVFMKSNVQSRTHTTDNIETIFHFQGAESIINKMYKMYSQFMPDHIRHERNSKSDYIKNLLPVKSRLKRKPEAYLTMKLMGLQRIFAMDTQTFEAMLDAIAWDRIEAMFTDKTYNMDFLKIIDVSGHSAIIPTECGLPLYVSHKTPVVVSGKASLSENQGEGEASLTVLPVINYKLTSQVGVFSPFSQKFFGTGVDMSLHATFPITIDAGLSNGQYSVNLRTPLDDESQKEKPLLHFIVKPFTTVYDETSFNKKPVSKSPECKTIKSSNPSVKKEYSIGRDLGIVMDLKINSEEPLVEIYDLVKMVYQKPTTLLSMSIPLKTLKSKSISLVYKPKESKTKDVSLVFSYGYGAKQSALHRPIVISSSKVRVPDNVAEKCTDIARQWRENEEAKGEMMNIKMEQCIHIKEVYCRENMKLVQTRSLTRQELQECRQEAEGVCTTERENFMAEDENDKKQDCIEEEISFVEKKICEAKYSSNAHSLSDVKSHCMRKSVQHRQRHYANNANKESINKCLGMFQNSGSAVSLTVEAALHNNDFSIEKSLMGHVYLGEKKTQTTNEETEIQMETSIRTHDRRSPYVFHLGAFSKALGPSSTWDKEALVNEDLTTKIRISSSFGFKGGATSSIDMDLTAIKSEDQKTFARTSAASVRCNLDLAAGRRLTESCEEARRAAVSLDKAEGIINISNSISESPLVDMLTSAIKTYLLPYLAESHTSYRNIKHGQYQVKAQVSSTGRETSVSVFTGNQKSIARDLRLGSWMVDLLPLSTKDSIPVLLVQKATNYGAPSTCYIEDNKVSTFDKILYDYPLNDCEHVVFKDCSETPRVLVSVTKTALQNIVKAVIDSNDFEVQINNSSIGTVKINGVTKFGVKRGQNEVKTFKNRDAKITLYEDGVYEIFSPKYSLTVRTNGHSLEVVIFQERFRNLACGLCGDLNDERTADVKSAAGCIMSRPGLAALSYMVLDGRCTGIPTVDLEAYRREAASCIQEEVVPTKVNNIFLKSSKKHLREAAIKKHLDMVDGSRICFSREMVRVCGLDGQPAGVTARQVPFFCVGRDQEGSTLQRIAQRGERIPRATTFPTAFTRVIYEPTDC